MVENVEKKLFHSPMTPHKLKRLVVDYIVESVIPNTKKVQ